MLSGLLPLHIPHTRTRSCPCAGAASRDAQAQAAVKRMDLTHARDRRETAAAMRSGTTSADGSRVGSPKAQVRQQQAGRSVSRRCSNLNWVGQLLPLALNLSVVKEAKELAGAAAARERACLEPLRTFRAGAGPRLREPAGAGAKTARTAVEEDRRGLKGN